MELGDYVNANKFYSEKLISEAFFNLRKFQLTDELVTFKL